jgi:putative CocE/NonD family hydrolase
MVFANGRRGRWWLCAATAIVTFAGAAARASAAPTTTSMDARVTMSDGISLDATVTGVAPLVARPVIVEFSPYGPGTSTTYDGPAYNYLLVQIRGTGDSDGQFDALGPRTQSDVQQTLRWACTQPWSDGKLGLNGFSASAITVYNSLHLSLPCVRTAVLKSGTYSLYRDLLYPGAINNFVPGAGVLALIGAPALAQGAARLERAPLTGFDTTVGLLDTGLNDLEHPALDSFWRARQFQGDANRFPVLMVDSFYDVESPGAFEAFRALRGIGDHLLVVAGHDGSPAGTDGGVGAIQAWFDHYLLGANNGIDTQPRVQMLVSVGSRENYMSGGYLRYSTSDWPAPGTTWKALSLSAANSGSGASLNRGSLVTGAPGAEATQPYLAVPSFPTFSDLPNTAFLGPSGLNQAAADLPLLTETILAEPLSLTYTTAPLAANVTSAGPAALDLQLSSTAPATDIWAVISDVWPDGSSHPVATARLNTDYPGIVASQSLTDSSGDVVAPWGDFAHASPAPVGSFRPYQLSFWPIGNEFRAGDRIRLTILGASAASLPALPAVNSVRVGGTSGSRLLLPVLPGSAAP